MPFLCDPPCQRSFATAAARDQHKANSPLHTGSGSISGTVDELASLGSGIAHAVTTTTTAATSSSSGATTPASDEAPCTLCNIVFVDRAALQHHQENSPRHKGTAAAKFYCVACNKAFGSKTALRAHIKNSPKHVETLSCDDCNKTFGSEEALNTHLKMAPVHREKFPCELCHKKLKSADGLEGHMRGVHKKKAVVSVFPCETCDVSFASASALEAHMSDSPNHKVPLTCEPCNKTFESEGALEDHVRDAPAHKVDAEKKEEFICAPCNKTFGSETALDNHFKDSPKHKGTLVQRTLVQRDTPLDVFFQSYRRFDYDRDNSPETNFRLLRGVYGWPPKSDAGTEAWRRYQDALVEEIQLWFGNVDDIHAWHHLCRALSIRDPPLAIDDCIKVTISVRLLLRFALLSSALSLFLSIFVALSVLFYLPVSLCLLLSLSLSLSFSSLVLQRSIISTSSTNLF